MKVFISGPMKNFPNHNYDAFMKAEENLINLGYSVFNPRRIHFDGVEWSGADKRAIDIAILSRCDAIYQLDGWDKNKGSKIEYEYAVNVGMTILNGTLESKVADTAKKEIRAKFDPLISSKCQAYRDLVNLIFNEYIRHVVNFEESIVRAKSNILAGKVANFFYDHHCEIWGECINGMVINYVECLRNVDWDDFYEIKNTKWKISSDEMLIIYEIKNLLQFEHLKK